MTTKLPLLLALLLAATIGCSGGNDAPVEQGPVVPAMTGAPTLSATAVEEGTQLTLTVPVNSTARRVAVQLGSDQQVTGEYFGAGAITGNEAGEGFISGSVTVPTGAIGTRYIHLVVTDAAISTGTLYVADSAVSATSYAALDFATSAPTAAPAIPLAQVTVVPAGPPNLVVTVWPGDEIVGEISVYYSVTNVGGGIAGPSTLGLFNAPATLPGVGASPDLHVEVPSVPAGTSVDGVALLLGSTSDVYAYADLFDTVAETDETDNLASPPVAPAMTGAPTVSPNPIESGMELTLTVPVNASVLRVACHLGWLSGPTWYLGAVEGAPSSTGSLSGTFRVPSSASGSLPVSCSVSNDLLSFVGRYENASCLFADEIFFTDRYTLYPNCNFTLAVDSGIPITFVTVTPPATPNLIVKIDSVSLPGATIDVAYTVSNTGGAAAGPFSVGFFADPATVPAAGSTADLSVDVPSLAANAEVHGFVTLTAPSVSAVYALADLADAVAEFDETDNLDSLVLWSEMPVMTGPPVVSPDPAEELTALTVTVPVDSTARRVLVSLVGAAPPQRSFEDIGVLTGNFAGEGYISGTVTIPLGANGANYVGIAVLDDEGTSGTRCDPDLSRTYYTCRPIQGGVYPAPSHIPPTPVTILASTRPNLIPTIGAVTPGTGTVDLTITVTNRGKGTAGPSVLGLFLDRAAVPPAGATPDRSVALPSLAAGASSSTTITVPATFSVHAIADQGGVLTETIELDNLDSWSAPAASVASGAPVGFVPGGTGTSTVEVSGAPSAIALATVTLEHARYSSFPLEWSPPDVEVTLTSPSGTAVTLISGVAPDQTDGIWSTVFEDWAPSWLGSGENYYSGSLRPTQPLSAFVGEDANGDWTLTVRDFGAPHSGSIGAWSLGFW